MNLHVFMTFAIIMSHTVFGKVEEIVSIKEFKFTGCLNGGIKNEFGGCICSPQFTGTNCETSLVNQRQFANKEQTTIHHLTKRNLKNECEIYGSGSGSASGSGMENYEETMECPREKAVVNGKCEFVKMFEGTIKILNQNYSSELYDRTSEVYMDLSSEIQCLINRIFDGVEGYLSSEVRVFRKGSVVVYYVIKLESTSDITSYELDQILTSQLQDINTRFEIAEAQVTDRDECWSGFHACDPIRGICNNTDGSYTCTCEFGYTDAATDDEREGSKCRHVCKDEEGGDYCLNGADCYITVEGSAVCSCADNYQGDRCEREWIIFLNATVGLGAALGALFVVFVFVTIMLCARTKTNQRNNFIELESNSQNGEYTPTTTNEIKGISNPYVASDEGVTVATNQVDEDPDAPPIQDDKL